MPHPPPGQPVVNGLLGGQLFLRKGAMRGLQARRVVRASAAGRGREGAGAATYGADAATYCAGARTSEALAAVAREGSERVGVRTVDTARTGVADR